MKHLIRAAVAAAFAAYNFHERHLIARGKAGDDLMAIADATRETTLADYATQVADLQPVTADDFDLPPMRRHGDIAKALAELDAVASVGDIKWEASA